MKSETSADIIPGGIDSAEGRGIITIVNSKCKSMCDRAAVNRGAQPARLSKR